MADEIIKGKTAESAENPQEMANEVMDAALAGVKAGTSDVVPPAEGGGNVLKGDSVADNFRGLPMRELISAPLIAAAEAQQQLASTAWEFYQKIAFEKKEGDTGSGKTRVLEFEVERPIQQQGQGVTLMKQKIQAPFIGLVPIPSLLIDRIDVDFQMEVTTAETTKSTTTAEASTSISSGLFVKAEITGKVSTSRENTRSTNQTAKYQVHVSASQQQQTEGLSKLMDIMASCIEPISVKESSGGGGQ